MRIVGGRNRGRPLASPPGRDTRPTSDRTREAVFNILDHHADFDYQGETILDVFAGSGAQGLEALSRGAGVTLFIENDRAASDCIAINAASLGETGNVTLINRDATALGEKPAVHLPAMLAFLDPPYGKELLEPALVGLIAGNWLLPDALVVCEMKEDQAFDAPDDFALTDERNYGKTKIIFLTFRPSGAGQSQMEFSAP